MEKTERTHLIPVGEHYLNSAMLNHCGQRLSQKGRTRIKLQFSNPGSLQRVVLESSYQSVVIRVEMEGQ